MPTNWFNKPLRLPKVPHSMEDMSHNFKTTTKFGLLTPIGVEECVPADECKEYYPAAFFRLSPLLYPIMHRVHARMHTFEVPFRILMGEQPYQDFLNGEKELIDVDIILPYDESIDPEFQDDTTVEGSAAWTYASVAKYDIFTTLGYPRASYEDYKTNDKFRLYKLDNGLDYLSLLAIWRDWFADVQINATQMSVIDLIIQQYQDAYRYGSSYVEYVYSGIIVDLYSNMGKDYFTTARPKPEYGDPVNLTGTPTMWKNPQGSGPAAGNVTVAPAGESPHYLQDGNANPLTLDLTIRELWRREQIQRFFDVTNTFGNRTREWLAGHMGVIFPDDRLMIPRLLQTTVHDFTISEVMQTSETETTPLGSYAGKGTLACRGKRMRRFFVEHSLLITVLSVIPEVGYAQARLRYQFKKSVFDFAIPEFNNIGYQEIYKGELYGPSTDPKGVFGYTMRYSEYRFHPNRCSNAFADDDTLLDFHLNRKFDSDPGLNPSFISANQDQFYRIFADTDADMDSILVDAAIINKMWRPVSAQPSSMHL